MSHLSREKLDLVTRTKKVIGQLESVLRGLNDDEQCADVLQRLAAARGAINSLMGELLEDHIRNHMPRNSKSSEEVKARFPLAEAKVEVQEVKGNPGYYTSKFYLRPHYQLEGLTVSLRLVSKLPSVKAAGG